MKQRMHDAAPGPPTVHGPGIDAPAIGGLDAYLEHVAPPVVSVTYGFMPAPQPTRQSVKIRFTGHRVGVNGKPRAGDQFVHEETIDDVLAGSGPIAITAKIHVNPGEWAVTAKMLPSLSGERGSRGRLPLRRPVIQPVYPATWSWRRWKLTEGSAKPVTTCPAPLVRAPGVILGSWAVMSLLAIVTALVAQHLVISADRLRVHHVLPVTLAAILAGVIGAKLWYVVLHRHERRWDGWCVQGLVLGIAVVATALLASAGTSIGTFFDASAPALLFGMGIGRLGCFFAGCCCGRPTASRWGIWSSDRRPLGARRIPTQLFESGFALAVGGATALAVVKHGPAEGAWFVAALAAYTIGRQGILRMRDERKSRRGGLVTAAIAAVVLVVDIVVLGLGIV